MIPRPPPLESLPAGTQLIAGTSYSTIVADLDFETYSEAGFHWDDEAGRWRGPPNSSQGKKGLFTVGAAVYTEHPTCEVLSLAYDLKDGRGRRHWRHGLPSPTDLFAHLTAGGVIEAWNVGFERWVWENVCVPRMGWPAVRPEQWRCAMAKARAHALPGSLDKVGEVLALPVLKDKDGKRLLDKFSVPRNPTQADARRRIRPLWTKDDCDWAVGGRLDSSMTPATQRKVQQSIVEDHEDTQRLAKYNETDIIVEAAASAVIPDLSPDELRFWQDDQVINRRGVQIDLDSVHACIAIIEQAHRRYGDELQALAGCAPSEVAQLKGWLHAKGVHLDSLDEDNVAEALGRSGLPPEARRALEIRAAVGSASVKKVFAMRNQASRAGRLHDLYTYHGARTGRPTGNGPQPTNLPKAGPRVYRCECGRHHGAHTMWCHWCGKVTVRGPGPGAEWSPEAMADALEAISHRSLDWLEVLFGDAMLTIAGVLRGLFVARPGCDLVSSDFTAIEGVVIACMAGEAWRVEAFAQDRSLYVESASRAFNIPLDEFTRHKAETGQHHPMRQIGKGMELGLGFGGWITALRQFDVEGTDDELKRYVLAWRDASPAIVELWGGQMRRRPWPETWTPEMFGLEGAAVQAVERPGEEFAVRRLDGGPTGISYLVRGDALYCRVPSGGLITYHRPRLTQSDQSWRGLSLSFEGWNTNPKAGPPGWIRMNTYSGKLSENVTQRVARDIQMNAIRRLHDAGYPIVMHTYDEVVAEVPRGFGSVEQLEQLMTLPMPWSEGWPIKAAGGWRAERYRKS